MNGQTILLRFQVLFRRLKSGESVKGAPFNTAFVSYLAQVREVN